MQIYHVSWVPSTERTADEAQDIPRQLYRTTYVSVEGTARDKRSIRGSAISSRHRSNLSSGCRYVCIFLRGQNSAYTPRGSLPTQPYSSPEVSSFVLRPKTVWSDDEKPNLRMRRQARMLPCAHSRGWWTRRLETHGKKLNFTVLWHHETSELNGASLPPSFTILKRSFAHGRQSFLHQVGTGCLMSYARLDSTNTRVGYLPFARHTYHTTAAPSVDGGRALLTTVSTSWYLYLFLSSTALFFVVISLPTRRSRNNI